MTTAGNGPSCSGWVTKVFILPAEVGTSENRSFMLLLLRARARFLSPRQRAQRDSASDHRLCPASGFCAHPYVVGAPFVRTTAACDHPVVLAYRLHEANV